MNENFLKQLLQFLRNNKELPYYQAERRIDIFLNFYLEDILNHFLNSNSIKFVVPEFPLKKDINAGSTRIDYLCCDIKKKEIYFVELKTDDSSFKDAQLDIYKKNKSWDTCLDGLSEIQSRTKKKNKIKFQKLNECLHQNELTTIEANSFTIKIIYLLPTISENQKSKYSDLTFITFNDLINFKPNQFKEEWSLICEELINPILQNI